MKYAIYDKAADGYLTKMEFEVGYSEHTQFECGYNEYITEAKLLDTPKEAADAIVRIESFKFMDKGRFVMHSFDDTLKDQYIISEAGKPTKVVDNITVDLNGAISVKYGTMAFHWSTDSLEYAIVRMNALQKAKDSRYTAWCNTFDIYKVIPVIDERSCGHYQFINVTVKGLEEYAKDDVLVVTKEITDITEPLNKRIEELEKANYDLGEQVTARGAVANRLQEENNKLEAKVESIKEEARHWKTLYEKADTAYKRTNKELSDAADALELLKDVANIDRAKKLANDIINICEATTDPFELTLEKFSQLYEAVNDPKDDDDTITHALKSVLEIFSALEDKVRNVIDESVTWKHKAMKAEKSLNNQLELNHGVCAENHKLCVARDCLAEIIYAIRYAITDNNANAFDCIKSRMRHDPDFNSDAFLAGVRENIKDICAAEKKNIANNDLKNSEIARLTEERDKALERAEKFKGIANSVYGMTIPGRCCGKQLMADILSGKKIPISKDKYDSIITSLKLIDLSYEGVYGTMIQISPKPKPTWLPGLMNELKNLTE